MLPRNPTLLNHTVWLSTASYTSLCRRRIWCMANTTIGPTRFSAVPRLGEWAGDTLGRRAFTWPQPS